MFGLSVFQLVMVGTAGLLAISVFWEKLTEAFSNINLPSVNHSASTDSLTEIVFSWEKLKDSCEKKGLMKAVDELKKIFPLLVIKDGEK